MGDLFSGVSIELLIAAVGGVVCVVAIAVGARNMLGSRHDEVIDRLERTTHGMDLLPMGEQKGQEKTLARIASILRPFARLARPSGGKISRGSRPR